MQSGLFLLSIPLAAAVGPLARPPATTAILLTPLPAAEIMTRRRIETLDGLLSPPTPESPPRKPPCGDTPADPPAGPASRRETTVVVPNADGLVDLCGLPDNPEPEGLPNPFRLRNRPPPVPREIPVAIESVLVGERPQDASAIIDGKLYSPGDTLEGLAIASIGGDAIELRREGILLRLPVRDRPLLLRLPR